MRLRLAKKIVATRDFGWALPDGGWLGVHTDRDIANAESRLRRHEKNSPRSKIAMDAGRLAHEIGNGLRDWKSISVRWDALKSRIRAHWNPEDWDETQCQNPPESALRELGDIELLVLDLEYYSDRWCDWRVGVIDRRLESFR